MAISMEIIKVPMPDLTVKILGVEGVLIPVYTFINRGKVQNSKSHKKKHSSKADRGRSAAVAGEDEDVRDDESDEDAVKAAGEEEEEGWEDEKPSRWHMVCTNEQVRYQR